jgi:DNA-binding NarL/FixJ family response regulator
MIAEKILVIEDNVVVRTGLMRRLETEGYAVLGAVDGSEAIQLAKTEKPNAVILDMSWPTNDPSFTLRDGMQILVWMQRTEVPIPVIVYTNNPSPTLPAQALASGAYAVFRKSVSFEQLLGTIRAAIDGKPRPAQVFEAAVPASKVA